MSDEQKHSSNIGHIFFDGGACPRDLNLWVLIWLKCAKDARKSLELCRGLRFSCSFDTDIAHKAIYPIKK